MTRTTALGMLTAVLTAGALAGCGAAATPAATAPSAAASAPATATAVHNDADVAFVQHMIPHHTQAVTMSQLVTDRASSPQVIALAAQIAQAQQPEITRMQGFLRGWNVPAAPTAAMGGMGDGGTGMAGMMSDQQMQQLGSTTGAAFDRMWLQMMIDHHAGAVVMAQTELRDGTGPDAKALAQQIIDVQQAEITTMKQLLATV